MKASQKRHVALLVALFLGNLGLNPLWGEQPRDLPYVLTVRRMDCPAESAPAMAALSKIPGVKTVTVDYRSVTLSIVPKRNASPSPLAVWEVAEQNRLEPAALQTAYGTYYERPRR